MSGLRPPPHSTTKRNQDFAFNVDVPISVPPSVKPGETSASISSFFKNLTKGQNFNLGSTSFSKGPRASNTFPTHSSSKEAICRNPILGPSVGLLSQSTGAFEQDDFTTSHSKGSTSHKCQSDKDNVGLKKFNGKSGRLYNLFGQSGAKIDQSPKSSSQNNTDFKKVDDLGLQSSPLPPKNITRLKKTNSKIVKPMSVSKNTGFRCSKTGSSNPSVDDNSNSFLFGTLLETLVDPNIKDSFDFRLKHFIKSEPTLPVKELPSEALQLFAQCEELLLNHTSVLKEVRSFLNDFDNEFNSLNADVIETASNLIDLDFDIQRDADCLDIMTKTCSIKAQIELIQPYLASKQPFGIAGLVMSISNDIDLIFVKAQTAFKQLQATSLDLVDLGSSENDLGIGTLNELLDTKTYRVVDGATKAFASSYLLRKESHRQNPIQESRSDGFVTTVYKPKDLNFNPSVYEISLLDSPNLFP